MKQLLQSLRSGETSVTEVPLPQPRPGFALVRTAASLVSAGTERTLVAFAEKNLVGKALSRPDLVRQVVDKARREGIITTLEAAFNRLDQPMPLGYSSAGTIVAVGEGLHGFQMGDRVACAGGGFAVHAEYGLVPQNLLAKLPPEVDFESGAFATLGAIALHGLRLGLPQVGERVAVIGLGLLGLLAVQLARAAGCSVFGVDLDARRVELACQLGARAVTREAAEDAGRAFSQGLGCDLVLICADSASDDPVALAGALARDRGRVVAVGAVGLDIPRKVYYEKELDFRVSRSYGPGRYDSNYEERGQDYPAGFVRWTEGRNLQAVVDLMAAGKLDVRPIITHRFPIDQAPQAYELITGKLHEPFLGVLLTYPPPSDLEITAEMQQVRVAPAQPPSSTTPPTVDIRLGVLGAGNYASAMFLPAVLRAGGAARVGIASGSGLSARNAAARFGFQYASSSEQQVLTDPEINLVAILTRHNQHARQVLAALQNGKHAFCEKPLAITAAELDEIEAVLSQGETPLLTAGFNRRFAPMAVRLKQFLAGRSEPLLASYRVNAGFLPLTHWLHDPQVGGGRIVGEGCHFIDFLSFLVGANPVEVTAVALPDAGRYREDNVLITLTYPDGSLGSLTYLANGDKSFPKERVEVFYAGRAAALDDFRTLELVHDGQRQVSSSRLRQDKGHQALWEAFLAAVRKGGPPPIPYNQVIGTSRAALAAVQSLHERTSISLA
ncbi:MAG: bi-domain-containing oxidoreductase [Anaerolineaceae bacterium]|nr:bi-domain-containing oxidoreductase [Anaerolineaceae bacterium]